ncbi:hypothetical protein [Streptomyces yunnanensis]|uniref:Uncharacterized protein n=1 Tax=Streptomyces yunnanensis TaxID=156453 RepID=A0A9X8N9A2_9ACTN|nr:hypothetical protein [Streptomyces yunnanensis]SHN32403.1 hypothetical protein SAMN05216268_13617 [Streptomyces yunnanensis]
MSTPHLHLVHTASSCTKQDQTAHQDQHSCPPRASPTPATCSHRESSNTGPDHIDANAATHRLTQTRKTELVELGSRLSNDLAKARTFRDPDLTEEATTRRRTELEKKAREQAAADLDRIEHEANAAASLVRTVANKATAARQRDAAEQLLVETRQTRAWDRARALLEAGRTVPEVIKGADANTLHALRAELPTYLAAQRTKPQGMACAGFTELDPAHLLHTINRALVDHLPKPQGAALRARLDLDALEPGLRETLAGLRREVNGTADPRDGLRTAIAACLADQQAGALPAT